MGNQYHDLPMFLAKASPFIFHQNLPVQELSKNGNKARASGKVYAHIAPNQLGAVFQCWKRLPSIWIANSPQCSNPLQWSQLLNRLQRKRNYCTALWERIGSKEPMVFRIVYTKYQNYGIWWALHITRDWKILENLLTWPMAHVFAPIPCGQQCTNPWRKQSMVAKSKVSRETPS